MRKWYIALFALACVAVVIAIARSATPKEPTYQERPLSYWVLRSDKSPPDQNTADKAVRQIGTNALPFLVKWTRYERPAWLTRVVAALPRLPIPVQVALAPRIPTHAERRAIASPRAFQTLGTNAAAAIPELTQLMRGTNAKATAQRAIFALGYVGTNGLPALLAAAEDQRYPFRWDVVTSFAGQLSESDLVGPTLISWEADTNDPERSLAAKTALMLPRLWPEVRVPAMAASLETGGTNSSARLETIRALLILGSVAVKALPALTNASTDPDPQVRTMAMAAIKTITKKSAAPTPK